MRREESDSRLLPRCLSTAYPLGAGRFAAKIKWCPGADSNRYTVRHRLLRPACLPIPPPGHLTSDVTKLLRGRANATYYATEKVNGKQKSRPLISSSAGACSGTKIDFPRLG